MFRSVLSSSLRVAATNSGRRLMSHGFRTFQNQNKSKKFLTAGATTLVVGAGLIAGGLNAASNIPDYKAIRSKIAKIIEDEPSHGPLLIRLAWHASGTYNKDTKTGGSNGATMRFNPESKHGANAGLQIARDLLEPIKKAHPEISYSDLWTLAGSVAVEELGGPVVQWRAGRTDKSDGGECTPDGRLPDADKGHPKITAKHVRDIFYRMGFNDQEIVALLGAHAVGRCHPDRSGYVGPWTRAETSFSNEYFRELIENKWTKKNWSGPEQFEDPSGTLMMLPADMVLIQDPEFRKYTEIYAKDQNKFFKDFSKAFQKLLELGAPVQKGWFGWLFG